MQDETEVISQLRRQHSEEGVYLREEQASVQELRLQLGSSPLGETLWEHKRPRSRPRQQLVET